MKLVHFKTSSSLYWFVSIQVHLGTGLSRHSFISKRIHLDASLFWNWFVLMPIYLKTGFSQHRPISKLAYPKNQFNLKLVHFKTNSSLRGFILTLTNFKIGPLISSSSRNFVVSTQVSLITRLPQNWFVFTSSSQNWSISALLHLKTWFSQYWLILEPGYLQTHQSWNHFTTRYVHIKTGSFHLGFISVLAHSYLFLCWDCCSVFLKMIVSQFSRKL